MNKNVNLKFFKVIKPSRNYLLTAMRTFLLMITIGLGSAFANSSYTQKEIDIDVINVTIEQLFEEIQDNSEFVFFYKDKTIDPQLKVTLQMKKKTLATILNKAFYGTNLKYSIDGRQVVIKKSKSNQSDLKASVIEETPVNQEFKLTGTVLDADGIPLPGASIIEKGTTNGTYTDFDGNFSLTVSNENASLVFSFIGFTTFEQSIDGQSTINITLQEDAESLDEVVVIGYGTVKKSDLTGSVSTLKGEVMEMTPIVTMEQAMQGRLAGVNVSSASGAPGAGMNITIRGASSISGGNQPLYVIDGMPFFNNSDAGAGDFESTDASTNLNPMASMNPNDIESIEVLKDASSTAIYGSRGANGVIMITTKRGKSGKGKIDIDFKSSYSLLPETIPLVNAQQYALISNEYNAYNELPIIYDGQVRPSNNGGTDAYFPTPEEIPGLIGDGTNWQEEIMRNAISNDLNVRFSGGTKDLRYNISTGLLDTEGLLKNTDFQRYTLRANLNAKLNEVVSIVWNVNGASVSSNRSSTNTVRFDGGGAERSGTIVKAFMASPVMGVEETWYNEDLDANESFGSFNPLVDLTDQYYFKNRFSVSSNLSLNFQLSESLLLVTRGGIRYVDDNQNRYWNPNTSQGFRYNGKSLYNSSTLKNVVNENFLKYTKKINKHHNLNVLAGMSVEKKSIEKHRYGFIDYSIAFENGLYYDNFATGQDPVMPITRKTEANLVSGYGRINYNYKNRYYLTATGRGDGSSVFAENNKWAFFPSFGAGWSFQKEDFMANLNWLSNGKLRASYGLSGNQAIAPYQSLPSLGSVTYSSIDGRTLGVLPIQPGNIDLKWETTTQYDLGIDLGFFKNRYKLTFDYYNKTTDDLLLNLPVLSESGFGSFLSNFGKINNEGFEVEMTLIPISKPDLRWSIDLNWSTNDAELRELTNFGVIDYTTNIGGGQKPTHRLEEGGKIGNFFGLLTDGLLTQEDLANGHPTYNSADAEGELKFVDLNEDGIISNDDGTIIGNAYPDFLFGINNSFTYKNFTLSFLVRGAMGQDVLNMMLLKTTYGTGLRGVPSVDYYNNRWTPENTDAYYPRVSGNGVAISDRLIEDGGYVRLQNVTLNYNIPKKISGFTNAQVYASGYNLYTWHNYSGYDPEVSSYGQNLLRGGIDRGSYPRSTTFTLGVKLGF